MVFISTNVPLEEIKSKKDIEKCDWFLFQFGIKSKNVKHDDLLYKMHNRSTWYPYWYDKPLRLYLMAEKFYIKSDLYNITENFFQIVCMNRVPTHFTKENVKRNFMLPKEKRIMTENDILEGFKKLGKNNFKETPIIEVVIGG